MDAKPQVNVTRLIILAVLVVLEGLAIISIALQAPLLPVPDYAHIISVVVYVLPVAVGFATQRIEAAIVLALLPLYVFVIIYLAIFAVPWTVDLFTVGTLAGEAAGPTILFGALGALGFLLRRAVINTPARVAVGTTANKR